MKPLFRSNPYLRTASSPHSLLNYAAGFALTLCIAGLTTSAQAGSAVWNGATGSAQTLDWNNNANWNPNTTFPNGVGEIATITKDLTGGNTTINLNQPVTVGTLLIGDVASSSLYTIASATTPNPAFNLIFDNTDSTNAVLTSAPTSGTTRTDLISANVVLEDSLDISVGLNSLQISGSISEATPGKGLTKTGTGALYIGLGGSTTGNSYTGTTTIENGTVRLVGPATTLLGNATSPVALGTATSISSNLSPTLQLNTDLTNPLTRDITVGASNSPTTGIYTINTNNGSTGVSISGNITLNQNLTISGSTTGGYNVLSNITTGSTGAKTLTFSGGSGSFTSSGAIGGGTGTISLVKTGGNTLNLLGSNTYTGGTSISGGTVVINSDAALGTAPGSPATNLTFTASGNLRQDAATGAVTLNANRGILINAGATATLNANGATNILTINGPISNQATGVLNMVSSATSATSGTVVLAGENNFAADTTIALAGGAAIGGGTLRLANNNALGTNAITVNGNAGGGNGLGEVAIELSGGITIGSNVTYNIAGHTNTATPAGDNLRNYSGNNTFNGTIRVTTTGGSYQIDSAEAGSLLTLGGTITNTLNSTRNFNFIGNGDTLISGTFSETGGSNSKITLTKYGAGALTLPNTYTYLGGVTLHQGTINLNSTTALGAAAGTFTINGGTINNTSGSGKTIANNNPLTLNGDFTFGTPTGVSGTNDLSLGAGAVTLGTAAGTSRTITTEGGGLLIVAGVVANGTTANSIIKNGTGGLKLDGANTYNGGTTLNAGQLQVNNNQALGTGPLIINGGGMIARNSGRTVSNPVTVGGDFYIGAPSVNNAMNFSGTVDLGGATRTITVVDNPVANDSTMSGVLSNGGLVKIGGGTLALSAANTYSGPTIVNEGTLSLSGGNPLDFTSEVTINGASAKLVLNGGTIPHPISLNQGTLEANGSITSLTVADGIGNTVSAGTGASSILVGPVTFQGDATLNLTSGKTLYATDLTTNPASQVIVNVTPDSGVWLDNYDYPIIDFSSYASSADASHFTLIPPPGLNSSQHATLVRTANSIVLRITTDALQWTGNQSGDWTTVPVGGARNWRDNGSPAEYENNRSVVFDDSSIVLNVNLAENVSPSSVIFSGELRDYTVSSSGGFGIQTGSLFKSGIAKATLATENAYTGATTISAGTLEVSGSITSSSSIAIAANSTLALNVASAKTYANPITGAGMVSKSGAGTLTLTGANSFTGSFTLNAGPLNIDAASALGAGPGQLVINGGSFDNTSGSAITVTGNKPQLWNADFAFTGSNNLDLGTGAVTLGGDGDRSVTPGGPGDTLIVGEIKSSLQGLNLSGGGTLVATSTGAFGNASVIAGTLTLGSGTTLQINRSTANSDATTGDFVATGLTGTGTVCNGAAATERSIQVNNTTDCTFAGTIADGGAAKLALNKQGTGTLFLTGASTYTGPTVVGGGIINVSTSNALGNSNNVRAVSRNGGIQLQDNISLPATVTFTLSNDGIGTVPYAIANVSGNNTINGQITMTSGGGGSFIQSDSGTLTLAGNITSDQARPLTLLGASTGANTVSGVYSNGTTGVNTLTKSGAGTWTLTGANTYTGSTTINEGTLQLGNGTTDGTIANTSGVINNAVLVYNWAGDHSVPYVISGNGSLIKTGAGTATLAGVNTYTGTTTVNAGELAVNGSSIADTGTVVINGGKVNLTGAETVDKLYFGGVLQPAGTYSAAGDSTHFSGSGTLIVTSGPAGGYSSWASSYPFTVGVNDGQLDDPDADGINNLLEYVLGGVPVGTGASNTSILPTQNLTATDLVLTFRRSDASESDVALKVQWSTNMTTWNDFATIGPVSSLPQVGVVEDSPSATLDTITVTIPRSLAPGGKLFARVRAVK